MTPELKKHFAPLTGGEIEFNEPDWHWTGIGVSMPTPVSDGKYIYVNNGFKFTACYDLAGTRKWLVYHKDIACRHHWVELFAESPMLVDGRLEVHMLDRLICYERETGKVLWMVKTRAMVKGHGMGQPTVLRLTGPTVKEPVTAIFSQFGELVRLEDGHVYADDIGFFDNCACLCSNGRDTIYANNGATGGAWDGNKYGQGRRFMEPGGMAIRFSLGDRDTVKAEQLWSGGPKLAGVPFYHQGRIYSGVGVHDAATGKEVGKRSKTKWYNGSILADGRFYGNLKDGGDNDRGNHVLSRRRSFSSLVTR